MFHKHLNPKDVLRVVFGDMIEVLKNMRDAQVSFEFAPAHSSNIYLIVPQDKPKSVGLGRAEPFILTNYAFEDWTSVSLFNLDVEQSESRIPIGAFIGFIHPNIFQKNSQKWLDCYVGILVSPIGMEYIGCFCSLDDLDSRNYMTHEEVKSNFPKLISEYKSLVDFEFTH